MFRQYPYEGHQNPAIHWGNNDIVDKATPAAVEINGDFSYFNDEVMPLAPEERLVVADFMCGLSEAATVQTLSGHVASEIAAIGLVERTFMKFGVARDRAHRLRGPERLMARVHFTRALDADPHTLPMPEDWQQPFRDLVLMLASGLRAEQLSKSFQFTNADNHLAMAASRTAESLGLAHLEKGGPTLVALAASLLPGCGEDEAIKDRLRSPLTDEERSLFETLPPRGGPPLLPIPSIKTQAPGFTSVPRLTSKTMPPPAPDASPATRATPSTSQPNATSSRIIRPHEEIEGFKNKSVWLQFEGGSASGPNLSSRLGRVSLLGIQHAEVQVGPVETPSQVGDPLTHAELAAYCARTLSLSTNEIQAAIGVHMSVQGQLVSTAHYKIGLRRSDPELGTRIYERTQFDVSLPAAFEEPQLFRTLKPPQFGGLEREYELLMEFGPHLIGGNTRRDVEYRIITSREDRGYSRNLTSTTAIGRDMDTLRASLNLNTLGLKMLYLVQLDYQKQLRARAEAFFARPTEEN